MREKEQDTETLAEQMNAIVGLAMDIRFTSAVLQSTHISTTNPG